MMPLLADRVAALVSDMQSRAADLDRGVAFPTQDMAALRQAGALSPPLPVHSDGAEESVADQLAALLTLTGSGNLSAGRILEAHINALHLIGRYGSPWQRAQALADVESGHLFALWVTDPASGGLRMRQRGASVLLCGGKQFCSGAGYATRVLVTAWNESEEARMMVLRLGAGETVTSLPSPLAGMRAAVTGAVDFTGCEAPADSLLGQPGDYLREPDFSAGAWRGSAVALGGLITLVDLAISQLRASGRLDSPHTQVRLGQAMIARQTSRMWVQHAARIAENPTLPAGQRVATVGLARVAVETACLDTMIWVQRSLGLSAFRQGNPVELVCRDLSTYLRQPAPDETLTDAARWFADHAP